MSGNSAWDEEIIVPLEAFDQADILQMQALIAETRMSLLVQQTSRRYSNTASYSVPNYGFIGDGFQIIPNGGGADMHVQLRTGTGLAPLNGASSINGVPGLNDYNTVSPLVLSTYGQLLTVPTATGGKDRVDLVYAYPYRRTTDSTPVQVLTPSTGVWGPVNVNKTLSWELYGVITNDTTTGTTNGGIHYVQGSDHTAGTVFDTVAHWLSALPTLPSNAILMGYVNVPSGTTSIGSNLIVDERTVLVPGNAVKVCASVTPTAVDATDVAVNKITTPPGVSAIPGKTSGTAGSFTMYFFGGRFNGGSVFEGAAINDATAAEVFDSYAFDTLPGLQQTASTIGYTLYFRSGGLTVSGGAIIPVGQIVAAVNVTPSAVHATRVSGTLTW